MAWRPVLSFVMAESIWDVLVFSCTSFLFFVVHDALHCRQHRKLEGIWDVAITMGFGFAIYLVDHIFARKYGTSVSIVRERFQLISFLVGHRDHFLSILVHFKMKGDYHEIYQIEKSLWLRMMRIHILYIDQGSRSFWITVSFLK